MLDRRNFLAILAALPCWPAKRKVLRGTGGKPQTMYMSRVEDPEDWDPKVPEELDRRMLEMQEQIARNFEEGVYGAES